MNGKVPPGDGADRFTEFRHCTEHTGGDPWDSKRQTDDNPWNKKHIYAVGTLAADPTAARER